MQCQSCRLSSTWGKKRIAAQETASRIAPKRQEEKGSIYMIFAEGGIHVIKHIFSQNVSTSLMKLLLVKRNSHHHEGFKYFSRYGTEKHLPTMREDLGSIPGLGRSPGEGNGNPLQYSCLENSMDGGAWWATVLGVTKGQTRLSNITTS